MVREDSMEHLMEASRQLHGQLVASPLWELLKTEPVIVQWITALNEVDLQIKPKEPENVPKAENQPKAT